MYYMDSEIFKKQIQKLNNSKPVISAGMEYDGLYALNNKSAEKYIRENLRGNYLNNDTGELIKITRKGAEKVTRHDAENMAHLKSIALIPALIRHSIFVAEEKNEKDKNDYDSFRYFVVGMVIGGVDYTVKLVVGVKTPIEKTKLLRSIDEIKRPFASKESSDDGEPVSDVLSACKDGANESRAKLAWAMPSAAHLRHLWQR